MQFLGPDLAGRMAGVMGSDMLSKVLLLLGPEGAAHVSGTHTITKHHASLTYALHKPAPCQYAYTHLSVGRAGQHM